MLPCLAPHSFIVILVLLLTTCALIYAARPGGRRSTTMVYFWEITTKPTTTAPPTKSPVPITVSRRNGTRRPKRDEIHSLKDTGRLKSPEVLKKLLIEEEIIPDVIDVAPKYGVTVLYKTRTMSFGNKLTMFDIVDPPKTVNWPLRKREYYTLILTGLDIPDREDPTDREYLHWLVTNIPERDLREGDHLPPYGGAPRECMRGVHRLVMLIYEQKEKLEIAGIHHLPDAKQVERRNFSTREFTKTYGLGDPYAINFADIDNDCDVIGPTF